MNTATTTAPNQARVSLIRAAAEAFPLSGLDAQLLGSKTAWGTKTRPPFTQAHRRAIQFMARAGEVALNAGHDLSVEHVAASIKSFALHPADVLVCRFTGDFMAPKNALRHRGEELARAITEMAILIREVEQGGPTQ